MPCRELVESADIATPPFDCPELSSPPQAATAQLVARTAHCRHFEKHRIPNAASGSPGSRGSCYQEKEVPVAGIHNE